MVWRWQDRYVPEREAGLVRARTRLPGSRQHQMSWWKGNCPARWSIRPTGRPIVAASSRILGIQLRPQGAGGVRPEYGPVRARPGAVRGRNNANPGLGTLARQFRH